MHIDAQRQTQMFMARFCFTDLLLQQHAVAFSVRVPMPQMPQQFDDELTKDLKPFNREG